MKNNLSGTQSEDSSFISDLIRAELEKSIQSGDGFRSGENTNNSIPELKEVGIKEYELGEAKGNTPVPENGNKPAPLPLEEPDASPPEFRQESLLKEQEISFSSSFLIELIQCIKNNLLSVRQVTVGVVERINDQDLRKRSSGAINEEIKKIDALLNSLLNYVNINTPITRTDTVSIILDEILEANERQLEERKIKVVKRCEKNLPETFVHDEQVRFVLNSVLQYAILSTPSGESIEISIKSVDLRESTMAKNTLPVDRGYIEASMWFPVGQGVPGSFEPISGMPKERQDGTIHLMLRLVKGILEKNHGTIQSEVDDKKKRLVALRFPLERRKVVYYEPITI